MNKSFKFQNSSQSYLLKAIVNDLSKDSEMTMEESDDHYVIKFKVNYPNNADLVYQKVNKVEVYNDKDVVKIKVNVNSIDLKAGLSENDFKLEDYVKEIPNDQNENNNSTTKNESNSSTNKNNSEEKNQTKNNSSKEECSDDDPTCKTTNSTCVGDNCEDKEPGCEGRNCPSTKTGVLEDIVYPLYIPSNTYLSGKDKVDTDTGERVILTFGVDKSFVLVEEVASVSQEFEIIPVYGDPLMLNDTIAALSENSLYWTSNNVSYYLAGNDLSSEEILNIARNMNQSATVVSSVLNEK